MPNQAKGPSRNDGPALLWRSNDRQTNVDVVTRGVGVGTYLMSLGHQRLGVCPRHAGHRDFERDVEPETTLRAWANSNGRCDRCVCRHLRADCGGHKFHGAEKAGGIARCKELFGVVAGAAAPAKLLRGGELDVESAVKRRSTAVAA